MQDQFNPTMRQTHRKLMRVRSSLIVALALTLLAAAGPQPVQARGRIPVLLQITNNTTGDVIDPRVRSQDGNRIVFVSDGDVMGPGTETGHTEVYLYQIETGEMIKITDTPASVVDVDGLGSWAGARSTDQVFTGGRPEFVAFVSRGDFDQNPDRSNADGNPEIFLWELESGVFHQLTDTQPPVINRDPYPSDSGKCIVFSSTGDLDNNDGSDLNNPGNNHSNEDGSEEVFVYSLLNTDNFPYNGNFTQASNGPEGTVSERPVIGGYWFPRQCQTTAYMSNADQVGLGLTGTHIFIYDRNSGKTTEMIAPKETPWGIQPGDYLFPNISSASPFARGPFVVFQTNADLWRNGSSGWEMFRYRVFHPRQTQYTDIENGSVERPVVSDGGGIIVFQSSGEMLDPRHRAKKGGEPPFNADGNYEIFRTKGRRKIWQLTRSENCQNEFASVRDDGTAITWRSTCNHVGNQNPNGVPQVFLYTEVKKENPLSGAAGCLVANGCCNEANGCYTVIQGRKPKPRKKDCISRPRSGCKPPPA